LINTKPKFAQGGHQKIKKTKKQSVTAEKGLSREIGSRGTAGKGGKTAGSSPTEGPEVLTNNEQKKRTRNVHPTMNRWTEQEK